MTDRAGDDLKERRIDRFAMRRRDFLRLSSVAAVGVAASAFADGAVQSITESLMPRPLPLMGVGYWNGTFAEPSSHRLVNAEHLSSGDRAFSQSGARLRIAGFWRAPQHENEPLTVGVNVHFPVAGAPDGRAPFIAWASVSPARTASPTAFTVPVDGSNPIELSVDTAVRVNAPALHRELPEPAREESFLRIGMGGDGAKLRRGVYFVAVRESSKDPRPDWSSIHVVAPKDGVLSPKGTGPLFAETLFGRRAVPFSYVVLTADYATV
ncbi:MAG TPA: hypothetical protein VGJ82_04780 [Thermoanaerobaculia bacterium]